MKILVSYNIPRSPFSSLPADWEIRFPKKEGMDRDELIRLIPEYDVLVSMFNLTIDREIIDAGRKLLLISNYGVGYNNIDTSYARTRGIAVTNTPESVNNPTAELAMALMLSAARRVSECNLRIRKEKEKMWGPMCNLGCSLEGKTLGIVGMGKIGRNVARKAEAFGMRVIYHNPHTEVKGYCRKSLEDLFREADFISLHTPLTTDTLHLVGRNEFALMKPTAILINTSRGPVVDEEALCEALETRKIAGAALDVFEDEPHPDERLYRLDNTILTPHIGTCTTDARTAMSREAVGNILNFFSDSPTNIVNLSDNSQAD